ncbi:ATP-binding cassette domain-containing protein [Arthrobacter sp. RIT-PI-e]|uniref:ATP-binding cassette domain-containing protein n=1 Tax=Arthrobacter sp. RIT-PI-e TaxID=1681197 RepID=UPI0006760A8D|nr:ATP-binding cassette domain-containing protein [Arthrobacter sp. RIT-PI-e]
MDTPSPPQQDPALSVDDLTLRAGKRTIFEDVTFDVPGGSLAVLAGASGSGKTALALALAGRLDVTTGRATVLGQDLPRRAGRVRRRVGFTGNSTVVPLDETLTVKHHVADAVRLAGPWWDLSATSARVDAAISAANDLGAALEGVFGADGAAAQFARARLRRTELARDASPTARFALGLVLALLAAPDVLVVGDVAQLRTAAERRAAWAALLTVGRLRDDDGADPLPVVATCQDWQELDELLDPGHRPGVLPLRPVPVHALDAVTPTHPAPADGATPDPLPAPEIR